MSRQLAMLRKAWNVKPSTHRMAFLLEVLAAGALHKRTLPIKPLTNLSIILTGMKLKGKV